MPVNDYILFRKGSSTEWNSANPVLASGEPGFDISNNILKLGDGVTTWSNLDPIGSGFISSHTEINVLSQEPQGFVNRLDSILSFNDSTRTFTIQPSGSSYDVYIEGIKVTKTGIETVVIDSGTALNYLHFDVATKQLHNKTTEFNFDTDVPIAYIHWNSDINQSTFFGEERHGIRMDSSTHKWIHNTFGMQYINGLSIGNYVLLGDGSSNSHAQISVSDGTLYQEDIVINIMDGDNGVEFTQQLYPTGYFPVYYHSGVTGQWVRDSSTPYPVKYDATRALYNLYSGGTWSVINVPNNRYFAMWLVATNDINDPILSIMGQREDSSLGSAENHNNWTDIDLTNIPTNELRPLYRLIFLTNNTFTNTPKSSLQSILDLRRSVLTTTYGVPQNDHGNLFGLGDDDHAQYVHINEARTISANHTFTNGLTINNGLLSATSGNFTSLSVNNTGVSLSGHTHLNTDITNWNEAVDDRVNNLLVGTSGINISYDDNANTLTIAHTGVSGGTVISNYGDNRLLTSDGTTTGINAESDLSFNNTSGILLVGSTSFSSSDGLQVSRSATPGIAIGITSTPSSGNSIAGIGAYGYDGSLNFAGSTINFRAAENWSSTNHGTDIQIRTTPTGTGGSLTEVARITSAGNVGIGTTTPLRRLTITGGGFAFVESGGAARAIHWGNTDNTFPVMITGDATTGNCFLSFLTNTFGNGATERMRIDSSGNVGIGTTSPTQKLHLNSGVLRISGGGANSNGEINLDSGTQYDGWQVRKDSSTLWAVKSVTAGNDMAVFVDNTNTRGIYIKTGGNVGIGTTNPSYKLDVFNGNIRSGYANNSALLVTASSTASTGASIAIQQLTGEGWTAIFADFEPYAEWGFYHDNPNNRFDFTAGDSTNSLRSYSVTNRSGSTVTAYAKVSILQSSGDLLVGGSVGIGTSSPASKLHIAGTSSTFDGLLISTTASGAGAYSQIRFGTYYPTWTVAAPASIRCIDDGNFSSHITFRTKTAGSASSADVERLRITSGGNLEIRTNAGNLSSAFVYNENGGELVHYDETQTAATLLDQAGNQTRLLELINGSNLVLGLGSSNTTGSIVFARAGYAEAMRIDSTGSAWIKTSRAWNDAVPTLNIGNDGDGRLQVRHIWGKASGSTSSEHLWLQFGNGANHVQIGNVGQGSNLYVGGDIAVGAYFSTGTAGITASNGYVYAKRYTNIDAVSTDTSFGLFFNGATDTGYAIYREAGAWTSPFPDLRIGFHTGIKIGANATYNGIRFYTDHDMSTQVMSINNSADPLGATNIYVNNSLQAGSSLRAPIFYDSNNTGYYLDPDSTSNLNRVNAIGWDTSGRNYSREWIELPNHTGLYSPLNGAHFYPNNASYGSWRIAGTRNGWAGLEFDSSPYNASLMINSNNTGIHINGVGWQWYWAGGTFYVSKSTYGGGTIATVLDTSNVSSNLNINQIGKVGHAGFGFESGTFYQDYVRGTITSISRVAEGRYAINGTLGSIVATSQNFHTVFVWSVTEVRVYSSANALIDSRYVQIVNLGI
jgi:hypothetical protein